MIIAPRRRRGKQNSAYFLLWQFILIRSFKKRYIKKEGKSQGTSEKECFCVGTGLVPVPGQPQGLSLRLPECFSR